MKPGPVVEPIHHVLRESVDPLDAIFKPRSVAVIGATERAGSVGRTVLANLLSAGFPGSVYPVNPKHDRLLDLPAYPDIRAVPEAVDLAIIITPAVTVPPLIASCAEAGVQGAIIISAGFKERGAQGLELEKSIRDIARAGGVRLIGPNCLGVMSTHWRLNATFAHTMALPGKVAFLSQSGALCTAILDWSLRERVGFSSFVSVGSMADVGWGDLISYLGDDPLTHSILLYMESIGSDAGAFLSAAREVALKKPIILIKAGRTEAAAKAAASHTGSLTGSDAVFDAACRRCGVLRVNSVADLFNMAEVLGKQPLPRGKRLQIITNAGGPGVLAADLLIGGGGELAQLSPAVKNELDSFLPAHWSHSNPIDVLGDADAERYERALRTVLRDPNGDGALVILAPQGMTGPAAVAERLITATRETDKPVLACWMGGREVASGEALLNEAGVPTFSFPDAAARAFNYLWQYRSNLDALYQTPMFSGEISGREVAKQTISSALAEDRTLLTEHEAKAVIAGYGIPTVETRVASSEADAVRAAEALGYPVAVKLYSKTITHKTDVGGVVLNLENAAAVRAAFDAIRRSVTEKAGAQHFQGVTVQRMIQRSGAYELIVGSTIDPQFGPVILFGAGGELVELFHDTALALPPLTSTLALRLMERTQIAKAFSGIRGRKPIDLRALEQMLVRFSQLVVENPRIAEIDINPLLVSAEGMVALDARVVLHPASIADSALPTSAIRPYPTRYEQACTLKDGTQLQLRPVRPEDEPLLVRFHEQLSEDSVRMRYLQSLPLKTRTAHERLRSLSFIDYNRQIAIVAEQGTASGRREIVGIARLNRITNRNAAEVSLVVRDDFQSRGLGKIFLEMLVHIADVEKVKFLEATMYAGNTRMRHIAEGLGFVPVRGEDQDGVVLCRREAVTPNLNPSVP